MSISIPYMAPLAASARSRNGLAVVPWLRGPRVVASFRTLIPLRNPAFVTSEISVAGGGVLPIVRQINAPDRPHS